jgi:hypothetical protein
MLCCLKRDIIHERNENAKPVDLLELVETEKFQERLCQTIRDDIHSSIQIQISNLQKTMNSKVEASILNTELIIVNKVIAEVTEHINNRIEKRIIELENRLHDSKVSIIKYKTD